MVANFFSNLAGGLLQSAFGQNAAQNGLMLSEEAQKRLMNHQANVNWKYYVKDLNNKYIEGRKGLEAANYNPMLALGGINANNNWTSPHSVNDLGLSENAIAGFSNATQQQAVNQQEQLIQAQVENYASQNEVNNATAGLRNTESRLNELKQVEQTIYNSNLDRNLKAEYMRNVAAAKRDLIESSLAGFNAQTQRIQANATSRSVDNQLKLINGQVELMKKTGRLTAAQAQQIETLLPYLPAEEISKIAGNVLSGIGQVVGGFGIGAAALRGIGAPKPTGIINPTKQVQFHPHNDTQFTKSGIIHKKYH